MSRAAPAPLDAYAARRATQRANARGLTPSVLAAEVAARMDERLDLMKIAPQRLLVAGGSSDGAMQRLRARYPRCRVLAVAEVGAEARAAQPPATTGSWLQRLGGLLGGRSPTTAVVAGLDYLPLPDACVDMVWSNLALHRYADPPPVFSETHRVLADEGLFMFSTLGPDTLQELRRSFAKADPAFRHVHDFIDMHDLGDMLVGAGFSAPVMDMETITLTYADVMGLIRELQASGAVNALQSRRRGLSGRGIWERLRQASAALHVDGRFPASFEIVYGHAWKPQPRPTADAPQVVKFYPTTGLNRK
jgi:malonyl-CoA O-methyltransferase